MAIYVPGRLTLFDLDGVILRHDSMAEIIKEVLKTKPWLAFVVLPMFLISRIFPATSCWRAALNNRITCLTLRGFDETDYRLVVDKVAGRIAIESSAVNAKALAHLRSLPPGEVIVVTGTDEYLAIKILSTLNVGKVAVVGSKLGFTCEGVSLRPHNVGHKKVTALRNLGVDVSQATFFTDSASDLPLISVVRHAFLVSPTRRSLRQIRGKATLIEW